MHVARILNRNLVTIPKEIVRALQIRPGDYVKVEQEGNGVRLVPVVVEEKWSQDDLEALRKIHREEKSQAGRVASKEDIRKAILGRTH